MPGGLPARLPDMLAACSASPRERKPPQPVFQLIFHNRYVEVFDLELQPDRQAPIHDTIYDDQQFWTISNLARYFQPQGPADNSNLIELIREEWGAPAACASR